MYGKIWTFLKEPSPDPEEGGTSCRCCQRVIVRLGIQVSRTWMFRSTSPSLPIIGQIGGLPPLELILRICGRQSGNIP